MLQIQWCMVKVEDIQCKVRLVKFWFKLLKMDNNRLPKAAYNVLFQLDNLGRDNWVTSVKNMLFMYGFGLVWYNQGVGNENTFLDEFVQRLTYCYIQNWHETLSE